MRDGIDVLSSEIGSRDGSTADAGPAKGFSHVAA